MEFESTQAKKLVQLLDNSEAQERDYWLRRTKKVLILWLMFFVLIAMVVTFLVIDVNERSKYVDYILHYVKYGDGTHTEAEDYGTDPRKATIYDTVGSIDPPKDEEIEGFRFNGKYYNSNNYEVPIDPSSNIASSLTSEKTIYMEYEYQEYRLTIKTDNERGEVKDDGLFTTGQETDNEPKKGKYIVYNQLIPIVPKIPITLEYNGFYIDDSDVKEYNPEEAFIIDALKIQNQKEINKSIDDAFVAYSNLLTLYQAANCKISDNIIQDYDGKSSYHIIGFHYEYKNYIYKYSIEEVGCITESQEPVNAQMTYLVTKEVLDANGNVVERLINFSNGLEVVYNENGKLADRGTTDSGDRILITTGNNIESDKNANVFKMPAVDLTIYLDWERDERYIIAINTIDDYTWKSVYGSEFAFAPKVDKVEDGYEKYQNFLDYIKYIGTNKNRHYNQVSTLVTKALTDGELNDWDDLYADFREYSESDWAKAIVINVKDGYDIETTLSTYMYYGSKLQDYQGTYYYPIYREGYNNGTINKQDPVGNWEVWVKTASGWKWEDVDKDDFGNISNIHSDSCIMVRPKWDDIETPVAYKSEANTDKNNTNPAYILGTEIQQDGFKKNNNQWYFNVSADNGFKLPTELPLGYSKENIDRLYVAKTGYSLVGWEVNCNFKYNWSTVLENAKKGYVDISTEKVVVNNVSYPVKNIFVVSRDFEYNGIVATADNFNKIINVEDSCLYLYNHMDFEEEVCYNFYYFEENNEKYIEIPKGYFIVNESGNQINATALWQLIEYNSTIDFNITTNNGGFERLDSSQLIGWNDSKTKHYLGYDNLYGLNDNYAPFGDDEDESTDNTWKGVLDEFYTKDGVVEDYIFNDHDTDVNYGKKTVTIKFPYNVDNDFYLPKANEIYRYGYTLVGYKFYSVKSNGNVGDLLKIQNFITGDKVYEQIVLSSKEKKSDTICYITDLYSQILIMPIWEQSTTTIKTTGTQGSGYIKGSSVINYNKYKTNKLSDGFADPIYEETYSALLDNTSPVTILDPDSNVNHTLNYIPNNKTVFGASTATVYIKLNDYYYNSTFGMELVLTTQNGDKRIVSIDPGESQNLVTSLAEKIQDNIEIVDLKYDDDFGIFNILDKNSPYYSYFEGEINIPANPVYTKNIYAIADNPNTDINENIGGYFIEEIVDDSEEYSEKEQPILASISVSRVAGTDDCYEITFSNVVCDLEFSLNSISYVLVQNSLMTNEHQYDERSQEDVSNNYDGNIYSLDRLNQYMQEIRLQGKSDIPYISENWYVIGRYEELRNIVEYNALHNDKIEYFILSGTNTFYVYDAVNCLNTSDFFKFNQVYDYYVSNNNLKGIYEDDTWCKLAIRLLGGKVTNKTGTVDLYYMRLENDGEVATWNKYLEGQQVKPLADVSSFFSKVMEGFLFDGLQNYQSYSGWYGTVYEETDLSNSLTERLYFKNIYDIDVRPKAQTTKFSSYLLPGKTKRSNSVVDYSKFTSLTYMHPTAKVETEDENGNKVYEVNDFIIGSKNTSVPSLNLDSTAYWYSAIVPENKPSDIVGETLYTSKLIFNGDYANRFWLGKNKVDGSYNLMEQYALIRLDEDGVVSYKLHNYGIDSIGYINDSNVFKGSFSTTYEIGENGRPHNRYVYSLSNVLDDITDKTMTSQAQYRFAETEEGYAYKNEDNIEVQIAGVSDIDSFIEAVITQNPALINNSADLIYYNLYINSYLNPKYQGVETEDIIEFQWNSSTKKMNSVTNPYIYQNFSNIFYPELLSPTLLNQDIDYKNYSTYSTNDDSDSFVTIHSSSNIIFAKYLFTGVYASEIKTTGLLASEVGGAVDTLAKVFGKLFEDSNTASKINIYAVKLGDLYELYLGIIGTDYSYEDYISKSLDNGIIIRPCPTSSKGMSEFEQPMTITIGNKDTENYNAGFIYDSEKYILSYGYVNTIVDGQDVKYEMSGNPMYTLSGFVGEYNKSQAPELFDIGNISYNKLTADGTVTMTLKLGEDYSESKPNFEIGLTSYESVVIYDIGEYYVIKNNDNTLSYVASNQAGVNPTNASLKLVITKGNSGNINLSFTSIKDNFTFNVGNLKKNYTAFNVNSIDASGVTTDITSELVNGTAIFTDNVYMYNMSLDRVVVTDYVTELSAIDGYTNVAINIGLQGSNTLRHLTCVLNTNNLEAEIISAIMTSKELLYVTNGLIINNGYIIQIDDNYYAVNGEHNFEIAYNNEAIKVEEDHIHSSDPLNNINLYNFSDNFKLFNRATFKTLDSGAILSDAVLDSAYVAKNSSGDDIAVGYAVVKANGAFVVSNNSQDIENKANLEISTKLYQYSFEKGRDEFMENFADGSGVYHLRNFEIENQKDENGIISLDGLIKSASFVEGNKISESTKAYYGDYLIIKHKETAGYNGGRKCLLYVGDRVAICYPKTDDNFVSIGEDSDGFIYRVIRIQMKPDTDNSIFKDDSITLAVYAEITKYNLNIDSIITAITYNLKYRNDETKEFEDLENLIDNESTIVATNTLEHGIGQLQVIVTLDKEYSNSEFEIKLANLNNSGQTLYTISRQKNSKNITLTGTDNSFAVSKSDIIYNIVDNVLQSVSFTFVISNISTGVYILSDNSLDINTYSLSVDYESLVGKNIANIKSIVNTTELIEGNNYTYTNITHNENGLSLNLTLPESYENSYFKTIFTFDDGIDETEDKQITFIRQPVPESILDEESLSSDVANYFSSIINTFNNIAFEFKLITYNIEISIIPCDSEGNIISDISINEWSINRDGCNQYKVLNGGIEVPCDTEIAKASEGSNEIKYIVRIESPNTFNSEELLQFKFVFNMSTDLNDNIGIINITKSQYINYLNLAGTDWICQDIVATMSRNSDKITTISIKPTENSTDVDLEFEITISGIYSDISASVTGIASAEYEVKLSNLDGVTFTSSSENTDGVFTISHGSNLTINFTVKEDYYVDIENLKNLATSTDYVKNVTDFSSVTYANIGTYVVYNTENNYILGYESNNQFILHIEGVTYYREFNIGNFVFNLNNSLFNIDIIHGPTASERANGVFATTWTLDYDVQYQASSFKFEYTLTDLNNKTTSPISEDCIIVANSASIVEATDSNKVIVYNDYKNNQLVVKIYEGINASVNITITGYEIKYHKLVLDVTENEKEEGFVYIDELTSSNIITRTVSTKKGDINYGIYRYSITSNVDFVDASKNALSIGVLTGVNVYLQHGASLTVEEIEKNTNFTNNVTYNPELINTIIASDYISVSSNVLNCADIEIITEATIIEYTLTIDLGDKSTADTWVVINGKEYINTPDATDEFGQTYSLNYKHGDVVTIEYRVPVESLNKNAYKDDEKYYISDGVVTLNDSNIFSTEATTNAEETIYTWITSFNLTGVAGENKLIFTKIGDFDGFEYEFNYFDGTNVTVNNIVSYSDIDNVEYGFVADLYVQNKYTTGATVVTNNILIGTILVVGNHENLVNIGFYGAKATVPHGTEISIKITLNEAGSQNIFVDPTSGNYVGYNTFNEDSFGVSYTQNILTINEIVSNNTSKDVVEGSETKQYVVTPVINLYLNRYLVTNQNTDIYVDVLGTTKYSSSNLTNTDSTDSTNSYYVEHGYIKFAITSECSGKLTNTDINGDKLYSDVVVLNSTDIGEDFVKENGNYVYTPDSKDANGYALFTETCVFNIISTPARYCFVIDTNLEQGLDNVNINNLKYFLKLTSINDVIFYNDLGRNASALSITDGGKFDFTGDISNTDGIYKLYFSYENTKVDFSAEIEISFINNYRFNVIGTYLYSPTDSNEHLSVEYSESSAKLANCSVQNETRFVISTEIKTFDTNLSFEDKYSEEEDISITTDGVNASEQAVKFSLKNGYAWDDDSKLATQNKEITLIIQDNNESYIAKYIVGANYDETNGFTYYYRLAIDTENVAMIDGNNTFVIYADENELEEKIRVSLYNFSVISVNGEYKYSFSISTMYDYDITGVKLTIGQDITDKSIAGVTKNKYTVSFEDSEIFKSITINEGIIDTVYVEYGSEVQIKLTATDKYTQLKDLKIIYGETTEAVEDIGSVTINNSNFDFSVISGDSGAVYIAVVVNGDLNRLSFSASVNTYALSLGFKYTNNYGMNQEWTSGQDEDGYDVYNTPTLYKGDNVVTDFACIEHGEVYRLVIEETVAYNIQSYYINGESGNSSSWTDVGNASVKFTFDYTDIQKNITIEFKTIDDISVVLDSTLRELSFKVNYITDFDSKFEVVQSLDSYLRMYGENAKDNNLLNHFHVNGLQCVGLIELTEAQATNYTWEKIKAGIDLGNGTFVKDSVDDFTNLVQKFTNINKDVVYYAVYVRTENTISVGLNGLNTTNKNNEANPTSVDVSWKLGMDLWNSNVIGDNITLKDYIEDTILVNNDLYEYDYATWGANITENLPLGETNKTNWEVFGVNLNIEGNYIKFNFKEKVMEVRFYSTYDIDITKVISTVTSEKASVQILNESGEVESTLTNVVVGEFETGALYYYYLEKVTDGSDSYYVLRFATKNDTLEGEASVYTLDKTASIYSKLNKITFKTGGLNSTGDKKVSVFTNTNNGNTNSFGNSDTLLNDLSVLGYNSNDMYIEYTVIWVDNMQIIYEVINYDGNSHTFAESGLVLKDVDTNIQSISNSLGLTYDVIDSYYILNGESNWEYVDAYDASGNSIGTTGTVINAGKVDLTAFEKAPVKVKVSLTGVRGTQEKPFLINSNTVWNTILNFHSTSTNTADGVLHYFEQTDDLVLSELNAGEYEFYGYYSSNYDGKFVAEDGTFAQERIESEVNGLADINYIKLDNYVRPLFGKIATGSVRGVYLTSEDAELTPTTPSNWVTEDNRFSVLALDAGDEVVVDKIAVGSLVYNELDSVYEGSNTYVYDSDHSNISGIMFGGKSITNSVNAINYTTQFTISGIATNTDLVDNCINYGNLVTSGNIAGIANNANKVTNCVNYGNASTSEITAGIAINTKEVINCSNVGSLTGQYVSGILYCGESEGFNVENCVNGGVLQFELDNNLEYKLDENGYRIPKKVDGHFDLINTDYNCSIINNDYYAGIVISNSQLTQESGKTRLIQNCENYISDNGGTYSAGIVIGAGEHDYIDVNNCYNGYTIGNSAGSYALNSAGIAYNVNKVTNCYNQNSDISGYYDAGIAIDCVEVSDCINEGYVTTAGIAINCEKVLNCVNNADYIQGANEVAGIAIDCELVASCVNNANLLAPQESTGNIAGIAVDCNQVKYCYNTASLTPGFEGYSEYSAGIMLVTDDRSFTITDCVNGAEIVWATDEDGNYVLDEDGAMTPSYDESTSVMTLNNPTADSNTVSGCYATGIAIATTALSEESTSTREVSGCVNYGKVNADSDTNQINATGIALCDVTINNGEAKFNLTNCINNGTISESRNNDGDIAVGIAQNCGTITGCVNNGSIDGFISVGIASNCRTVDSCVNNGNIADSYYNTSVADNCITVNKCINNATSGILARNCGTVSYCENKGLIGVAYECNIVEYCTNNVSGESTWGIAAATNTVRYCTNNGNITNNDDYATGIAYMCGDVIGCINNGEITGAYASGIASDCTTVVDCINNGTVSGQYAAGIDTYTNNIINCVNYGAISGTYATGIAIIQNDSISYCSNLGNITGDTCASGIGISLNDYTYTISNCVNGAVIQFETDLDGNYILDDNGYRKPLTNEDGSLKVDDTTIDRNTVYGNLVSGILTSGTEITTLSTITGCLNFGKVLNDVIIEGDGNRASGVFITNKTSANINILNCKNYSNISAASDAYGIANFANKVENCFNSGDIFGNDSECGHASGIVGTASTVTNCINTGEVVAENGNGSLASGIILKADNSNISICYSTGDIRGFVYVGGICATAINSIINNCYSTGSIEGCNGSVGGLIGYAESNSEISDCYSTSSVVCDGDSTPTAGGLIGELEDSTLNYSYAVGTISSKYYIGGLVAKSINSLITKCYRLNGQGVETGLYECTEGIKATLDTIWTEMEKVWTTPPWYFHIGIHPTFDENDGAIVISNKDDLLAIKGATINNNKIVFIDNVDLEGEEWQSVTLINCEVIGNNCTISNFKNCAMFGYVEGSTIKNLILNNFVCDDESIYSCASLVSELSNSDVDNCHSDVNMLAGSASGLINIAYNNCSITNCSVTGSINCTSSASGLLGDYTVEPGSGDLSLVIENCYSDCEITAKSNVSGLFGSTYWPFETSSTYPSVDFLISIKNCYVLGNVTATGDYVGGLISTIGSVYCANGFDIENCYVTGDINASGDYIGGLIGRINNSSYIKSRTITDCYVTGNVSGSDYVGGLIGQVNTLNIENCFTVGNVSATGESVGGLIGYCENIEISKCYSESSLLGESIKYGGGLIGTVISSEITDCYAKGTISGLQYLGGLCGKINTTKINNCYASGNVGVNTSSNNKYIGGLIGSVAGSSSDKSTITNAYASGEVTGYSNIGGLVGSKNYLETPTNCFTYQGQTINYSRAQINFGEILENLNSIWSTMKSIWLGDVWYFPDNDHPIFVDQDILAIYVTTDIKDEIYDTKIEKVSYATKLEVESVLHEKTGYCFAGWYTDKELTNRFESGTEVTESITLWPKFVEGTANTYTYHTDNGNYAKVTALGYDSDGNVVIPDDITYNGVDYKVTEIATGAKTLYNLGSNVVRLYIGNNVTSMPNNFATGYSYSKDAEDDLYQESLEYVYIGSALESIAEGAFSRCTALAKLEYGYNYQLKYIFNYAFYNCSSLQSICLDNMERVTYGVFLESGLTGTLIIPKTLTDIQVQAFAFCDIDKFIIEEGNPNYTSKDENGNECFAIIQIADNVMLFGSSATTTIPSTVTRIENAAFAGRENLKEIYIPKTVTEIGWSTFFNCSGLETVAFEDGSPITVIDFCTFENCASLNSINLPDNLVSIGNYAFKNNNFESITIPDSVTHIYAYAFNKCSNLASVNISDSSNLKLIGDGAFGECSSLQSIIIPNTVNKVGALAFVECTSLNSVVFKDASRWYKEEIIYVDSDGNIVEDTTDLTEEELADIYIKDVDLIECDFTDSVDVRVLINNASENYHALVDWYLIQNVSETGILVTYKTGNVRNIETETIEYVASGTKLEVSNELYKDTGWCFAGWYTDEELTNRFESGTEVTESITLWPKFVEGTANTYTYHTDNGNYAKVTALGYDSDGNVVVPDDVTYNGEIYNVTFINSGSGSLYSTNSNYVNFYIGNNVESIPTSFSNSYSSGDHYLQYMYIGRALKEIPKEAFMKCKGLKNVTFAYDSKLETIGTYAFNLCVKLSVITFPSNVSEISTYAFGYCYDLKEIIIPDKVASISANSFEYCTGLDRMYIPKGVGTIGQSAFYECNNLITIEIQEDSELNKIADWAFYNCQNLQSITIPESVTSIGNKSFDGCSNLGIVTFENIDNITIASNSFGRCANITHVVCGNNLLGRLSTIFPSIATGGSIHLEIIEGEDVMDTQIDSNFREKIGKLTVPNSVSSIGSSVFSGCSNLSSIIVDVDNEAYDSRDNCNAIINSTTNELILGCKNTTIPNTVTSIGNKAFFYANLTSVIIPASVTSIGEYAFYGCNGLTNVVFNDTTGWFLADSADATVPSDGVYLDLSDASANAILLNNCNQYLIKGEIELVTVTYDYTDVRQEGTSVTTKVETVEKGTALNVENVLYKDAGWCFAGWYTDEELTNRFVSGTEVTESITLWPKFVEGTITASTIYMSFDTSDYTAIVKKLKVSSKNVVIPDDIQYNGKIYLVVDLKSSVLEDSLWNLGSSIKNLYIGNYVQSVPAYFSCNSETKELDDPDDVTPLLKEIGMEYLYIGSSVNVLYNDAFAWCGSLEKVEFGYDSCLVYIYEYAFYWCDFLSDIVLPSSVQSIGYCAFCDCNALESFIIPKNVIYIGWAAFLGCIYLESITIPASVEYIGEEAFSECYLLEYVYIEDDSNLTFIGCNVFLACSEDLEVDFGNNTEGWYKTKSETSTSGTSISASYISQADHMGYMFLYDYEDYYLKRDL